MNFGPMTEQLADLDSHRIEGFTREGGHKFSVPLFTQIAENLWMGGCPKPEGAPQFNTIICLYPWENYKVYPGQIHTRVFMLDSHDAPDSSLLSQLRSAVAAARMRGNVLIHCQAGLNRSGLLTALCLWEGDKRMADVIADLRAKRCDAVLCNKAFEAYLMALGGE